MQPPEVPGVSTVQIPELNLMFSHNAEEDVIVLDETIANYLKNLSENLSWTPTFRSKSACLAVYG